MLDSATICLRGINPVWQVLREATEKPYLDIDQPALRAAISAAEAAGTDGSDGMLTRAVLDAPQLATLAAWGWHVWHWVARCTLEERPCRLTVGGCDVDASLGQSGESRAFRFPTGDLVAQAKKSLTMATAAEARRAAAMVELLRLEAPPPPEVDCAALLAGISEARASGGGALDAPLLRRATDKLQAANQLQKAARRDSGTPTPGAYSPAHLGRVAADVHATPTLCSSAGRPFEPAATVSCAAQGWVSRASSGGPSPTDSPLHTGSRAASYGYSVPSVPTVTVQLADVGGSPGHSQSARNAAANKLIKNHERVLSDLCRADGPPASQPELVRLPGQEREVNIFLREATRRLRQPGQRAKQPTDAAGVTWAGAAAYLAGRLQVSEEEVRNVPGHEGRKADMSPAAGAAMRAVLAEMGREGARHEAASKLITNHERVLRDLCRADGPPASQPGLARLPGQEREVNIFLREATRRLRKPGETEKQPTKAEGAAWAAAAKFLAGRLQVSEEEVRNVPGHEGRKADMSPAAGAAMRAVLKEMGREGKDAVGGGEGVHYRRRRSFSEVGEDMNDKLDFWRADKLGIEPVVAVSRPMSENEHMLAGSYGGHYARGSADCTTDAIVHGVAWLTFALFLLGSAVLLALWSFMDESRTEPFVGCFFVCSIASMTYFCKASGYGDTKINGTARALEYA